MRKVIEEELVQAVRRWSRRQLRVQRHAQLPGLAHVGAVGPLHGGAA